MWLFRYAWFISIKQRLFFVFKAWGIAAALMIFGVAMQAQVTFEQAYLVTHDGQKLEGWIANERWDENPEQLWFKDSLEGSEQRFFIPQVREFVIGTSIKYVRAQVRLEQSSDLSSDLNYDRNFNYEFKEVWLRVLIDGPVRLFSFKTPSNIRFYYQKKSEAEITLLRFKRFRAESGHVGSHAQFRQQLAEAFRCVASTHLSPERLEYKESDLIRFFTSYARCTGIEIEMLQSESARSTVQVSARLGLSTAGLKLEQNLVYEGPTVREVSADYGRAWFPRFGMQFEAILPSKGNQWSVFADPSFQKTTYQTQFVRTYPSVAVTVNSNVSYSTLDFPVGVRRYWFLNEESAFFCNLSVSMVFNTNSKIAFTADQTLGRPDDIILHATQSYLAFGLGFKVNNRLSLEGRVHTARNILGDNPEWNAPYGPGGSVILGVSL